jgi:hypothetical protein
MIGLIAKTHEIAIAEEFFQLFKTPWERFRGDRTYDVVLSTGELPADLDCRVALVYSSSETSWDSQVGRPFRRRLRNCFVEFGDCKLPIYGDVATYAGVEGRIAGVTDHPGSVGLELVREGRKDIRIGFDLFAEVKFLLTRGQPPENAQFATLDCHIDVLRRIIVSNGVPVVEIPPVPPGVPFISCLTHDVDFLSLRQHRFDRPMLGFVYRATLGTLLDWVGGRCSWRKIAKNAAAVLKLPFVHLGLARDFWVQFESYLEVERSRPSTFFIIPFKNRRGQAPSWSDSTRRGVRYDVNDIREWIPVLKRQGCELAVHGIDAWADTEKGREELGRITSLTGEKKAGLRMHWLYFSEESPHLVEAAGFDYDSTCGFNDAVGFRAGTSQVFQPLGTSRLLELPLHVQDTAMFFPDRMHLKESQAWELVFGVERQCRQHGGVMTVLWHDRSLVPERLWRDFYAALLDRLSGAPTWFGTARDVVDWFRKRRSIRFAEIRQAGTSLEIALEKVPSQTAPGFCLRVWSPGHEGRIEQLDASLQGRAEIAVELPRAVGLAQVPTPSV